MLLSIKSSASKNELENLIGILKCHGVSSSVISGMETSLIKLSGDISSVNFNLLSQNRIVESVKQGDPPYIRAGREFHPSNTEIAVTDKLLVGGESLAMIAGPCSVESEAQIIEVARQVKAAGANILRGGAFKPRTSPYSFQGYGAEGLKLLVAAKHEVGLPIVTEIVDIRYLPLYEEVDIIQVGARNMQNFELLKELGHIRKPILLKRGFANTIEELLQSAEYIMNGGNEKIILCERGIRTFEPYTRYTLDISAVPVLKRLSHLPVIIDPSHAAGLPWLIEPLAKAAIAAGADGLMIEVHNNPKGALSDGKQALTPDQYANTMLCLHRYADLENRKM